MFGKPVIKGTRITVEQILRKLAHPHLKLDDIHAAEAFATDYLANEDIAFG